MFKALYLGLGRLKKLSFSNFMGKGLAILYSSKNLKTSGTFCGFYHLSQGSFVNLYVSFCTKLKMCVHLAS